MGDTATSELGYRKQEQGVKLVWGTDLNDYVDRVEEKQVDITTLNLTGDHPLTNTNFVANETRKSRLIITDGGLSTAPTITVPGKKNNWWVENKGATYNVIISAGGVTVSIAPGEIAHVYCDGTDCFKDTPAINDLGAATSDLSLNSHKLTDLSDGTEANDAVNKGQLDASILGINNSISDINDVAANLDDIENAAALVNGLTATDIAATPPNGRSGNTVQALLNEYDTALDNTLSTDDVHGILFDNIIPTLLYLTDAEGLQYAFTDGYSDDLSDYSNIDGSLLTYTDQAIPDMTSNSAPSGTAAASSEYSTDTYAAWRAFDRNSSSYWSTSGYSANGDRLTYTFAAPVVIGAHEVQAEHDVLAPYKVEVQLADDSWVSAYTGNLDSDALTTANLNSIYIAKAVRWEATAATTPASNFSALKSFQVFSPTELITNAFTATTAPKQVRVSVIVDGDGTGLVVSASRDNGTTYSTLSSSDTRTLPGSKSQITGVIDVSGQPTGTSVRLKINDGSTHAYLLQWK